MTDSIGVQVYELAGPSGGGGGGGGGGKGAKPAKGGKDKDAPAYSEVCDACRLYLDADVEIPLSLMAQLIKFRLLIIKDADVKSRKVCKMFHTYIDPQAELRGPSSADLASWWLASWRNLA